MLSPRLAKQAQSIPEALAPNIPFPRIFLISHPRVSAMQARAVVAMVTSISEALLAFKAEAR
jgi:hypothetical protein